MMPDGDTAAHLRKQVGGLFFGNRLRPARHPSPASRAQRVQKMVMQRRPRRPSFLELSGSSIRWPDIGIARCADGFEKARQPTCRAAAQKQNGAEQQRRNKPAICIAIHKRQHDQGRRSQTARHVKGYRSIAMHWLFSNQDIGSDAAAAPRNLAKQCACPVHGLARHGAFVKRFIAALRAAAAAAA